MNNFKNIKYFEKENSIENPNSHQLTLENIILNNLHNNQIKHGCCNCEIQNKYEVPPDPRNIIEITCNGLLPTNFVEIPESFEQKIYPDDFIIVQNEESYEIAQVKLLGELVRIKRQNLSLFNEPLPIILRKANNEDLTKIRNNILDEERAESVFKQLIAKHNLEMKLINTHFQFDRKKLFFFYTADGRVDFRELAKELAAEFKTRIELRQIGVRDEAKKLGGLGSCGREFCCISFLNNFRKISTQLATEQNLASNINKLTGPCNKLKCCLSFETDI
ncbi:PSP1 domain-containing protein [Stygiobacter electus]|uniref:Regulatory iron-sulfur-containing complex subunit RicT n=1 Tax=Stygiobacter electus TaxID=3032292 RepID=A0AAE3NZ71_9BACT|nr:regulatory iron-sulfur-containing complex subunit RicT [Stygiobacter electus]MDF1611427.1 regulatory iron-sulfur-containing complex subunit RicT [Stygiobacter electus]